MSRHPVPRPLRPLGVDKRAGPSGEVLQVRRRGWWCGCPRYCVDALPNSDRYPGYEKHRWLVHATEEELLFIPKLSWLSLYDTSVVVA